MMALIEPFMGWIIAAIAIIGTLLMAWFGGSQSGKSKEQSKQLKKALGNVQTAQENDDEIQTMDEAAIDEHLASNGWMRNDK